MRRISIVLHMTFAFTLGAAGNAAAAWIEPNLGQAAGRYDYVARADDVTALIAADRLDLRLPMSTARSLKMQELAARHGDDEVIDKASARRHLSVRLNLLGADREARASGGDRLPGVSHYLRGKDPGSWVSSVPHLKHARYADVYPGIDFVVRLDAGKLEYDFELSPGADETQIRLRLDGAESFAIAGDGQWVATTAAGELRQRAPLIYRLAGGSRQQVAGRFVRADDDTVGFTLDARYPEDAVLIDPVIEFSGYVGGSAADSGSTMRENPQGDYVVLGTTASVDMPGASPGQAVGAQDVFIMQLDAASGGVDWITYVGGSANDWADDMKIDSQGNIVVVGYTESDDYPAVNAFQSTYVGGQDNLNGFAWDATIFKLAADGQSLIFSTYLGGADLYTEEPDFRLGFEWARGLDFDGQDAIYVVGQTAAADFPVTQVFQGRSCMQTDVNSLNGFVSDIYVAKFAPDGTRLESVCIGGTERDGGRDVVWAADGSLFVGGFGRSGDLPGTAGFYQPLPLTPLAYAPFVMKLSGDLTATTFATYVGDGIMQQIAVDAQGAVYGSGFSNSSQFPVTPGAFQTSVGDDPGAESVQDAFVFKLAPDGTGLEYATYLGGSQFDDTATIEIDSAGRAYVAGTTQSADFPLRAPLFDALGPIYGGNEVINADDAVQGVLQEYNFVSGFQSPQFFVARNGVNRWFSSLPAFDAPTNDFGTVAVDSRDVVMFNADGDGTLERVLFVNSLAPQHTYVWDVGAQDFVAGPDFGSANSDSRSAAVLDGAGGYLSDVVVANFAQQNDLHIAGNPVPVAIGQTDGRTTSVAVGSFGIGAGPSIVFGNDAQDVRLLPNLGNNNFGAPLILANGATAVTSLSAGDLNGDGLDDLVIGNADAPNQIVFFAAGVPAAPVDIGPAGDVTLSVLLVDVERDGDLDLLVGNAGPDRLYLNDGSGNLTAHVKFSGHADATRDLAKEVPDCDSCPTAYLATAAGVNRVQPTAQAIFAAVLNPAGSDLEFSTLVDGGGQEFLFRGLALSSSGRLLLAGNTDGADWPTVGSSAGYSGQGDAMVMVINVDEDGDGVLDGSDNCVDIANPGQQDSDGDDYGNACDADLNGDCTTNTIDLGIFKSVFFTPDADADFNSDGIVNALDLGILRTLFFTTPGPSGTGGACVL